ncbi:MAG: adenylyl-sulfate kinase [Flavobacteriales bacterium]|jgi:adenylylsulfate kinase|nr:adenylyl-sulfate kinase [Flavobacteriales bacterium]
MKNLFSSKNELISRKEKENLLSQKGTCFWLTGLSGSGKTTIAKLTAEKLHSDGILTQVLDGDNIRLGVNKNLTFSEEDRTENIRRIAEITKLFIENGVVTICCFISPTKKMRSLAKKIIGSKDFNEIFVNTSLEDCTKRDTKGLYKKAALGEIKNFTGVSAPFEEPISAELIIPTQNLSAEDSSRILYNFALQLIK